TEVPSGMTADPISVSLTTPTLQTDKVRVSSAGPTLKSIVSFHRGVWVTNRLPVLTVWTLSPRETVTYEVGGSIEPCSAARPTLSSIWTRAGLKYRASAWMAPKYALRCVAYTIGKAGQA